MGQANIEAASVAIRHKIVVLVILFVKREEAEVALPEVGRR